MFTSKVPWEGSLPGFGIEMINNEFHIAGICQVETVRLKRVVMYSIALGPRCFKWKMLSLSGPKALLFLQLLIAVITRSAVNVRAISNGFLLVSLGTTQVSLDEVCLSSFEVLNCWLNLVASYLDDENKIPLKVIAVCLLDYGFNKVSPFLPFMHTDNVLDTIIQSLQFR